MLGRVCVTNQQLNEDIMKTKLEKRNLKRLEHCIKTGLEVLTGRKAPPNPYAYWQWCSENNHPHIYVKHGSKYSYVSMDLPNAPYEAATYSKYLKMFYEICQKHSVVPTGNFSVLKVQKADAIKFGKELLEIGFALYAEHVSR